MSSFQVPPEDKFRHEALLYAGWAEFVAGTVPFIRDGIKAGEPVLVVESVDKIEMLRVALGGDADAVLFADMADAGANPARIIPAWHDFVSRHGVAGRRLRGIGEPIWKGRSPEELIECQRHESLLNVAFGHGQPWWLMCPYDTEKLDGAVIDEARRSHEFVTERSTVQRSDMFRGLEASGAPFDVPLPEPGTAVGQMSFGPDGLVTARSLVSRRALAAGLGAARSAELVTALNEVATNSIRHGGGSGILRVWQEQSAVVCEVRDKGRFDKPLADRERPSAHISAPRGLWLANQLCDLVQIRTMPEGTVVRLHMRRNPQRHLRVMPDVQGDPPPIN
ncbi:MAG: sensor histidine kinase [Candidatus Dormibacteraeota bacterium]|nr:sensor histidine kinase [Candidatus Dormibacteraeota bacterium]